MDDIAIERSNSNLVVADARRIVRRLDPSFFGFNLEWLEFQLGLWDGQTQNVRPEVVHALRAFPGAVYRYPGGTNANHIAWSEAIGPLPRRPPKPYVSWRPPLRAEFGPDEYLKFVHSVGGQAWYVANLYGGPTSASALPTLAAEAHGLARHMMESARNGLPPILRWELGNELDRGAHRWTPTQVAQAGNEIAAAIRAADHNARFVHLQQEYPAMATAGYTARRYNRELREAMKPLGADLALHLYYDGVPDTPPVRFFLDRLCEVVDDAKSDGGTGRLWITEHARVPNGFWSKTPRSMWPETANLAAAIALADMLVAGVQIPEVLGAFTHSLVGSGSPWPMFHTYSDGRLEPSATLLAMQILRQSMRSQVVGTTQYTNGRGMQGAPYAVRSAVLANDDRSSFTLWSVNRSNQPQLLELQIANAPTALRLAGSLQIGNQDATVGNHLAGDQVRIESGVQEVSSAGRGAWRIQLAPNSVNALLFH